jgi:ABC-type transporter Mla maintaining outer membrane lipid asymmetry ATPase subunit MlaF
MRARFLSWDTALSADNLVEIKDLDFAYDDRSILKGISLGIPRGKVVAIMGGSGCGKTTLLRLIGGQLKPSRGEVLVDDLSVPKSGQRRTVRPAPANGHVVPVWRLVHRYFGF